MPTVEAQKSRKRVARIVTVLGIMAAIALVVAGLALRRAADVGRASRTALCQEEKKTRAVLKSVLTDARDQTLKQPGSPQRTQALRFYGRHIAQLDGLNCHDLVRPRP